MIHGIAPLRAPLHCVCPMLDLIIRNGLLYDGTGTPPRAADVGIAADRIQTLGDLRGAESRLSIDATDRAVCPGFIDAHSHSDTSLLLDPRAVSKITQGITTEVCGNCGSSAAPRLGAVGWPSDWEEKRYPGPWHTVAEYRALLAQVRPAVNVVLLTGHNTLRAGVVGYGDRSATPEEVTRMVCALEQCLAEGSRGFSTGLIYPPGMFADPAEIQALATVAARYGGIYTTHMRSESAQLLEALEETLAVSRTTGVRTQVSHLKTSGRANWPLVDRALDLLRQARAAGLQVAADKYPYTASCTDLDVVFPAWAKEGGHAAILARLRDPEQRRRIHREILASRSEEAWGNITIGETRHPDQLLFRGQPLVDVARQLQLDPVEALLTVVERDQLRTSAFFAGMSEANLWRILAEPYVMLGTDASLRAPDGPFSDDYPHPRAYGTFPRFLRFVREGHTVALPEAIHRCTALPAEQFNLRDRGILASGKAADLVILDPVTITDAATYARPHQLASGIAAVVVNGAITWQNGRLTGLQAGRFL